MAGAAPKALAAPAGVALDLIPRDRTAAAERGCRRDIAPATCHRSTCPGARPKGPPPVMSEIGSNVPGRMELQRGAEGVSRRRVLRARRGSGRGPKLVGSIWLVISQPVTPRDHDRAFLRHTCGDAVNFSPQTKYLHTFYGAHEFGVESERHPRRWRPIICITLWSKWRTVSRITSDIYSTDSNLSRAALQACISHTFLRRPSETGERT